MYMDLEMDEDSSLYQWEIIEGSEDYILLEERGYEHRGDHYDTGQYAEIVRYLQRVSPNIRWRVTIEGTDSYGAEPSQWRVICVPQCQFSKAQYVFDRFLDGDDLENYCYTDRYPEIYDKLPNRLSQLKDSIVKFHHLLNQYQGILLSKDMDLASLLEQLAATLSQMYFYAGLLPEVARAPDRDLHLGTMAPRPDMCLSPYDEFFCVYEPYDKAADVEKLLLSDLLVSIYEDIEQGLIAFSENDPDLIAAAVDHWRIGFSIEPGWGRDITIALMAIHQARSELKRKQVP